MVLLCALFASDKDSSHYCALKYGRHFVLPCHWYAECRLFGKPFCWPRRVLDCSSDIRYIISMGDAMEDARVNIIWIPSRGYYIPSFCCCCCCCFCSVTVRRLGPLLVWLIFQTVRAFLIPVAQIGNWLITEFAFADISAWILPIFAGNPKEFKAISLINTMGWFYAMFTSPVDPKCNSSPHFPPTTVFHKCRGEDWRAWPLPRVKEILQNLLELINF